jgi:hypothetical protein
MHMLLKEYWRASAVSEQHTCRETQYYVRTSKFLTHMLMCMLQKSLSNQNTKSKTAKDLQWAPELVEEQTAEHRMVGLGK